MSATWYSRTVGDDSINAAAQKAGIQQATLNRQVGRGELSPEITVAIARAYGADVLDALIDQGLLSADDLRQHGVRAALEAATDEEIAALVLERMREGRGETFNAPIQFPRIPQGERIAAMRRKAPKGNPAADVDVDNLP